MRGVPEWPYVRADDNRLVLRRASMDRLVRFVARRLGGHADEEVEQAIRDAAAGVLDEFCFELERWARTGHDNEAAQYFRLCLERQMRVKAPVLS